MRSVAEKKSNKGWEIFRARTGEASHAAVQGSQRVGHDWATGLDWEHGCKWWDEGRIMGLILQQFHMRYVCCLILRTAWGETCLDALTTNSWFCCRQKATLSRERGGEKQCLLMHPGTTLNNSHNLFWRHLLFFSNYG